MNILVSGSSGLVGQALYPMLKKHGYEMIKLLRRPQSHRKRHAYWNTETGEIDTGKLDDIKGVVHLAGVGVAERRWSTKQKKLIYDSRVDGTEQVCRAVASLPRKPDFMLVASAIGYYGNQGDTLLEEDAPSGEGFLAQTVIDWEAAAQPALDAGIRVVHLRIGLVLSREGGALQKMLPAFKTGVAGPLGRGQQYLSWITLHDLIRAILFLMERDDLKGPFNLTAPYPVTNKVFTKELGRVLKRPTILPAPAFALRLALGKEMADEMLLSSIRAIPRRLDSAGFIFNHPTIEVGLKSVV